MAAFTKDQRIADFQRFNHEVYGLIDDRNYDTLDLLNQAQRFAMRALKGIRKGDREKLKRNLLVAYSWLTAVGTRLHIDIEEEVWKRFPALCSYCGARPCVCKKTKPLSRPALSVDERLRPRSLAGFQEMFNGIYPAESRSLADAGIHLGEEVGEVSEATMIFLGQHTDDTFRAIRPELADCISCIFGVANSAGFDVAQALEELFYDNCLVCHQMPCRCDFSMVAGFN